MDSDLRKLFDTIQQIEESEQIDEVGTVNDVEDEGDISYYADDDPRSVDFDHQSPHDRQPLDYDKYGDDPWGLGEDRGEQASANRYNEPGEECSDCMGTGTRTKAMWGPDAGYCDTCDGSGEVGFDAGPEGDRGEMANEDERGENIPDDVQITNEYGATREITNRIYEDMDEGILDPRSVAEACMSYMSESDVAEMARMNEFFPWDDEDDEDLNELSTDKYDTYTQAADKAKDYHDQAADSARKSTEIDGDPADLRLTKHFRKSNNRTRGMNRAKMGKARNTANAAARHLKQD